MSMTFCVNNKKRLFGGYSEVMSVDETLAILPNLIQAGIDESAQEFDVEAFYDSRLSDYECLIVGIDGLSGRGFEVGYDKNTHKYNVRIYTPSTRNDWKIALEYIKNLALKFKSGIINEYGDKFTPQNIENFNYEDDIVIGINSVKDNVLNSNIDVGYIYGINAPVAFNKEMIDEVLKGENPIDEFSEFVTNIQNLDAYRANQRFYEHNDTCGIIGSYVISQGVDTILPYKPSVEYYNIEYVKNDDVDHWEIALVAREGEDMSVIAGIFYEDFIANLPKDRYRFIDASYILVSGLSKEELEGIAANSNKGEFFND